jgi:hypothetical protein
LRITHHPQRRIIAGRPCTQLFLVNAETKKIQQIELQSPYPVIEYGLTSDSHTLYYTLLSTEADIWLLNFE